MEAHSIASAASRPAWWPARLALLGDERLARLITAGHEEAFAALYNRYHQHLYRYCRSILRDETDAQDALQSSLTRAFAALQDGRRDAPLRPWLFRIAHNESVSLLRRRRHDAALPDGESADDIGRSGMSVEEEVGERARFALLLHDLAELSERQRSALVMRELSGLSHEDIAIALGTSVAAAKQTIFEARHSMLEFAEGRDMPCEEVQRTISDADGRALRSRRVRAHLRDCHSCSEFAKAIPQRTGDLRAVVPLLPAVAGARLLARVVGAGAGHGGGGGAAALAGAAGKLGGAAFTSNALAGAAVVATAAVGVTAGLGHLTHSARHAYGRGHVLPAVAGTWSRVAGTAGGLIWHQERGRGAGAGANLRAGSSDQVSLGNRATTVPAHRDRSTRLSISGTGTVQRHVPHAPTGGGRGNGKGEARNAGAARNAGVAANPDGGPQSGGSAHTKAGAGRSNSAGASHSSRSNTAGASHSSRPSTAGAGRPDVAQGRISSAGVTTGATVGGTGQAARALHGEVGAPASSQSAHESTNGAAGAAPASAVGWGGPHATGVPPVRQSPPHFR